MWKIVLVVWLYEVVNYLIVSKIASTKVTPVMQKQLDAHAVAIDTMWKYQRIEKIINEYDTAWELHHMKSTIDKIREVIKDGNVD